MRKLYQYQLLIVTITVAIIISVSLRFPVPEHIFGSTVAADALSLFIAVFSASIGFIAAKAVTDKIICKRSFRRWLFGPHFVEGHWLIKVFPVDGVKYSGLSGIMDAGLMNISLDVDTGEFSVRTSRLQDNDHLTVTASEVANIRFSGNTIRYLNFFQTDGDGGGKKYGYAHGKIVSPYDGGKHPNHLEVTTWIDGAPRTIKQMATKLDDELVDKMIGEFKDDWIKEFLKRNTQFDEG